MLYKYQASCTHEDIYEAAIDVMILVNASSSTEALSKGRELASQMQDLTVQREGIEEAIEHVVS